MEDFKDVMLSEPPNRASAYSGAQPVGSFENYKGILLCDRPSDSKITAGGSGQPFLPPGTTDHGLGLQPSAESQHAHDVARRNLAQKKVKNTAQIQHRRQLKQLSDQRLRQRLDAVETQMEAENKKTKFMENQRMMRQAITQQPAGHFQAAQPPYEESEKQDFEESALPEVPPPPVSHVRTPPAASARSSNSSNGNRPAAAARPPKAAKPKSKPKWAMTEEEALDAEIRETDDLVQFAQDLDFERYLDDYEIREALSIMRERVDELKEEEQHDQARARKLRNAGPKETSVTGTYEEQDGDDNIYVQQTGDAVRAICEGAAWSPALDGRVEGSQIVGMRFGNTTVAGAIDGSRITWGNGKVWIRQDDDTASVVSRGSLAISDVEGRRARRAKAAAACNQEAREKDWDNVSTYSTLSERKRRLIGDEAMALAEQILSSSSGLKAVHSKQSLARVLEELTRKAYNDDQTKAAVAPPKKPLQSTGPPMAPPAVAVHQPNSGSEQTRILTKLQKSNDYVQNLPYLYRCPSI